MNAHRWGVRPGREQLLSSSSQLVHGRPRDITSHLTFLDRHDMQACADRLRPVGVFLVAGRVEAITTEKKRRVEEWVVQTMLSGQEHTPAVVSKVSCNSQGK